MEAIPVQIEGVGMGLCERKSVERRFRGYVEGLVKVIGQADRAGPVARLLHWTGADEWAQECGADGGAHSAQASAGAATVTAAFCRSRSIGRTGCYWPKCGRWCCLG